MRVLFLSQVLPYPPDAGPKVKTWQVLKYLASKNHEITLVTYVRLEDTKYLPEIEGLVQEVHAIPIQRARYKDAYYWLRSAIRRTPFLIERDGLTSMRKLVHHLLQTRKFDVVHADQVNMTQFVLPKSVRRVINAPSDSLENEQAIKKDSIRGNDDPKFVFDAHNAVWTIMRRMEKTAQPYFRPLLALEAKRMQRYEGLIVHSYTHTLAVSDNDRLELSEAERVYCQSLDVKPFQPKQIHVLPITVDIDDKQIYNPGPPRQSILIMGTLHYPPNADGVRWFVRDIYPQVQAKIPGTTLTIVGKNPPQDLIEMEALQPEAIKVTGYVADLKPFIQAADMMVVPVRVGGGMRVRILEGLSWGIPMVTTTLGLEGIEAVAGKDILVADNELDFINDVCTLLDSESLRTTLSENGRDLVKRKYDWRIVLQKLDEIYG
ncbi:MAG: glycosyltransferase family 4 protein [Anaerolineales bacterium]|nr:glycosyltransferase family 4 protein [Anaerolineales bacterium]